MRRQWNCLQCSHKAVQIYNSRIVGTDDEQEYTKKLMLGISDIVSSWAENEKKYEDTVSDLKSLIQSVNMEVSAFASEKLAFVITEEEGNKYYLEAEQYCNEMQYVKAMKLIQSIDKAFSACDSVEVLYSNCKKAFLEEISKPENVDDYEYAIEQLAECINIVSDDDFLKQKIQMEKDFISDIVCFWSEEDIIYENAVILLEKLSQSVYPEISTLASETLSFITIEEEGDKYHLLAEDYYEQKNYIEVMKTIKLIDKQYFQYEPAKELYDLCKNIILQYASDVKTVEEYESVIYQLDEYINIIDETEFGDVRVGNIIFYNGYEVVHRPDSDEIHIGKSIVFVIRNDKTAKVRYKLSGNLNERIVAEEMLIELVKEKTVFVNNVRLEINPSEDEVVAFNLKKSEAHLEYLKTVKEVLDGLGVSEPLDCENLTEKEEEYIKMLILSQKYNKKVGFNNIPLVYNF